MTPEERKAFEGLSMAVQGLTDSLQKATRSLGKISEIEFPTFPKKEEKPKPKRGAGYTKRRISPRTGKSSSRGRN